MAITVSGTSITFNDATTQTTAAVAGVTSAVAGSGIAVSGATGAVTFSQACPTAYAVGSYTWGTAGTARTNNTNYSNFYQPIMAIGGCPNVLTYVISAGSLSGTWKWMSATHTAFGYENMGIICRVS
jgi:hypothetical protein